MRTRPAAAASAVVVLFQVLGTGASLCACTGPAEGTTEQLEEVAALPANPNPNLDLLFVIDDSMSMSPHQAALIASFPRMMDVLAELEHGLPNLHIGVVTSDLGTASVEDPAGAAAGAVGGCSGVGRDGLLNVGAGVDIADSYIVDLADGAGGRTRNYTGALRDVFAANATVGDQGCGFEQHLGALDRALVNPGNAGFLRADANLAVVIIADEDDCTAESPGLFDPSAAGGYGPLVSHRCTRAGIVCDQPLDEIGPKTGCHAASSPIVAPVEPSIAALLATKPDPRSIMVAAIVGAPDVVGVELRALGDGDGPPLPSTVASCDYVMNGETISATPGVRLSAVLDAFPGRSQLQSICEPDLELPLVQIGSTAKKLVGDPCIETADLVDTDTGSAGIQPACEVVDIAADGATRTLPGCATDAAGDCYDLAADSAVCPREADHLRLRVRRAQAVGAGGPAGTAGTAGAAGTWTHVRCLKQAS